MVMAPLGIVSIVELTFAAMFIALLIWSLANYLYISFGALHMHTPGEKVYVYENAFVFIKICSTVMMICSAFRVLKVASKVS